MKLTGIIIFQNIVISLIFSGDVFGKSISNHCTHAIYISVVEIDYHGNDGHADIRVKVFYDDLEDALRNAFKKKADLSTPGSCKQRSLEIEKYFKPRFSIRINQQSINYKITDCEKMEDSIWLYFTANVPSDWKTIEIEAKFLMELFPTQSNIINLKVGQTRRFLRLAKGNEKASINLTD